MWREGAIMKVTSYLLATAASLTLAYGVACSTPAPVTAHVASVPPRLSEQGELIYQGDVFAQTPEATAPTFVYERRVAHRGDELVASHVTRDPQGSIVLAEEATHSDAYRLTRYELFTNQLGQRGTISMDGGDVHFRLLDGEREQSAVEHHPSLPVVVGPTLVGHIVKQLPALRAGETNAVRFAVLDRLETLGFELDCVEAQAGQTRVRMRPSSVLLRLAVAPIYFTFRTSDDQLLRLEGRVPTKLPTARGLKDFDARVEYRFAAARYL
jgi:hypothetical protein